MGEEATWPQGRITKRAVDAAGARTADSYIWDNELAGFGLKVTPAGRKVYLVQYRLGGRKGRTRRVTIGQHGELTPTYARAEAKRLLGEIASGRDPAAERDAAKADKSVAIVLEQFMTEHVRPKLKASTAEAYQRIARLYVLPHLARQLIGQVKRTDIARLHHQMRAKPYQANSTLAMLSKFFGWTESTGFGPTDPTHAGMSRNTVKGAASASSANLNLVAWVTPCATLSKTKHAHRG